MSYLLSPVFNDAQFDSAGDPLTGGKLYWYVAGTSTAATVYTDSSGATSHANPIVLDSRGEPGNPIYLDSAVSYKAVLKTSADVTIRTLDGITGIASPSEDTISEWVSFGGAPTYVDADEFTLAGDQTSIFHVNRRVRLTLSGSTLYGTIISSAYTTSTALQVVLDSGSLDGTLTAVAYGFAYENEAVPNIKRPSFRVSNVTGGQAFATTQTVATFDTEVADEGGNFASNTFTAPRDGLYFFGFSSYVILGTGSTEGDLRIGFIDTSNAYVHNIYFSRDNPYAATSFNVPISFNAVLDLDAGDTIRVGFSKNASVTDTVTLSATRYFHGFLL